MLIFNIATNPITGVSAGIGLIGKDCETYRNISELQACHHEFHAITGADTSKGGHDHEFIEKNVVVDPN